MLDENGCNLFGALLCGLMDCYQSETGSALLVMKFDHDFQLKPLNDVLGHHFSDTNDLGQHTQNSTGDLNSIIINLFSSGQELWLMTNSSSAHI